MRTVNFVAGFGAGCSLSGSVALEDNGAVQDVAAKGEIEVFAGVGFEAYGFHGGELVDGCKDCGCWVVVSMKDELRRDGRTRE
jgi:hypothetical protein